jgi:phospholipid/cholesterol/gamma-HCH transport system substrate-binding protein
LATRAQKTKVGLFLLICTALIAAGILYLAGFRHVKQVPYWIELDESVLGLGAGGLVEYQGVPVGKVADIYVTDRYAAHVDILLSQNKIGALREGMTAKLVLYSLATGTMCISLYGGDPSARILPAGSQIPTRQSLVKAYGTKLESLLEGLSKVAGSIETGLEGMESGDLTRVIHEAEDLVTNGRKLLTTADDTLAGMREDTKGGLEDFRRAAAELRKLAENADQLVTELREKVEPLQLAETEQQVRTEFSELLKRVETAADSFDTTSRAIVHESDNIEYNLRETLRTLNDSLNAVRELAVYLRDDPAALVRGRGKPIGEH